MFYGRNPIEGVAACRRGERSVPLGGVPRGGPPLGDSLVTFSSGRKSPGCRAERLHWGPQGLPAPHKLPGRGAERPPRNKHTPGTARQAVWPRTKPMRESGAASCRPLEQAWRNSICTNRSKREAGVQPPPEEQYAEMGAGSACRESGAASCRREMGAGSACRREGKAKIKKEPGRESGAASCRREMGAGSAPSDRISAIKCPLRERKTKTKRRTRTRIASRLSLVVEARGIEPLSENLSIRLSPSAVYRFCLAAASLCSAPANWRAASVDSSSSAVRDAPA